ncbi:bifunctional riboflavin kinase/FAD synthetase [Roseimaritima ulvae]|uniref:Riboflavin biosynthesis protein n=1 Tax=Roseimaritima ulvae TaxID=980254 RepID=A0A5B9R8K0_9BACT|nr:bifunctional riboflavin kinase/FAD synthetase [Roseimaritima ulvae]QEG42953.1 Riboflavin kinase [Roseimaritima ulvae]
MVQTLIRSFDDLSDEARGGAVSIGNFDGVHQGHASLVEQLCEAARRVGGPAVVVTFDPHPAAILRPEHEPARLTTVERRAELLARLGVQHVIVCPVDQEFLNLSAEQFFQGVVVDRLRSRAVVEGPNFFFGRNREGDLPRLRELSQQAGVELTVVEPCQRAEEMISSSQIRRLLAAGRIEDANQRLTAHYQLTGRVETGDQRGRQLGFPTANLHGLQTLVPAAGVYATRVHIDGQAYAAATHIGPNPTFGGTADKVEVHVLSFNGDLYGRLLSVDFLTHVRDIAQFTSVQELKQQLQRDIAQVESMVAESAPE